MLKPLLDFLFGKDPDIFDDKGRVRHKLAQDKWDDWNKRYTEGKEYNWRHHVGMRSKHTQNPNSGH